MLAIVALITGVIAGFLGLNLLVIWFKRGGTTAGRSHIRPSLMFGHAAAAVAGLALVIAYLVGGEPTWLAWTASVVILTASLLGAAMFIPWWLQRRRAIKSRTAEGIGAAAPQIAQSTSIQAAGSTAAGSASDLPVERKFPVRLVIIHGLVADLTLALVLLTALSRQ
jgi:hypothetical protein